MTKKAIKIAEVAHLLTDARKLCTVEERRVAMFNLNGTIFHSTYCLHWEKA